MLKSYIFDIMQKIFIKIILKYLEYFSEFKFLIILLILYSKEV